MRTETMRHENLRYVVSRILICLAAFAIVGGGFIAIMTAWRAVQNVEASIDSYIVQEDATAEPAAITETAAVNTTITANGAEFAIGGNITLKNSTAAIAINIPDGYTVSAYDEAAGVASFNDGAIKLRMTDEFSGANVYTFSDADAGKNYLSKEVYVCDGATLSIVAEYTDDTEDAMLDTVNAITDSVAIADGETISILGAAVNTENYPNITYTPQAIAFSNDSSTVAIKANGEAVDTKNFTQTIDAGGTTWNYSTIANNGTYAYITTIGETQYTATAAGNDALTTLFQ